MTHSASPARRARAALAFALPVALAGCAAQTSARYPSLLPRAIETRSDALPEVIAPVAAADAAADAALAQARRTLDTTVTAFTPAAATADRLARAAQNTPVGGERWIAAQSALAELDGYRATLSGLLTDADAMALARAADGSPEYPAAVALRADAQAAFDTQSARITAISAMLPAG